MLQMENLATPINDRSRTSWSPSMDRYFIDLLVEQVHKGNKMEQGFCRQGWIEMMNEFNSKFEVRIDKDILKNRLKTMKKQYNIIKVLLDQSGFGWDEERQVVTADDAVWEDYIKAHPEARLYRTKTIPNFNELSLIFSNTTAEGRFARSGHDVHLENEMQGMEDVMNSPLDNIFEESSQTIGTKNPSATPSTTQYSGKARRNQGLGMVEALHGVAAAINNLADKRKPVINEDLTSALLDVTNIDDDLFLKACDLLEDANKAHMFLAIRPDMRKKWLMKKIHPESF